MRDGLAVRPFSPADAVEAVLPRAWKGKAAVDSWQAMAPLTWLRALWAAIDRAATFSAEVAAEMHSRLCEWPLIPCGEELVQLKRSHAVLFDASSHSNSAIGDASGVAAAFAAFSSLRSLGIAIADPSFELKAIAAHLAPLNAVGIISALGQRAQEAGGIARLAWDAVSAEERAAVLDLISRDLASLAEEQLAALVAMPLFAFEDAARTLGPSSCGPLGPEPRRWTKPEFKSSVAQGGVRSDFLNEDGSTSHFLCQIPSTAPRAVLYSALSIVPMNRSDFYVNVVFSPASWRSLGDEDRARQLAELQRHYENIKDDGTVLPDGSQTTFGGFFATAPLFRSSSRGSAGAAGPEQWLCVNDLLDPTVELHHAFFPERLPHPSLTTAANLEWLRRCGMRESLTRSAFLAAALQVHERAEDLVRRQQPAPPELLQQAEQVTSGIFSCYSVLSDDAAQPGEPPLGEWLQSLGKLRVARPFAMPPRVFIEAGETPAGEALGPTPAELLSLCQAHGGPVETLVPFAGNVILLESSHTHLHNAASWSRTTVLRVPNAREVPLALVDGLSAQKAPSIVDVCKHATFLCSQPEETLRKWQRDQRDFWLDGRSRVGRSGSFKQQLEMGVYAILATCEPAALQEMLQDAPIVLLESAYSQAFTFVQPSRIFCDLNYGAPPYAYTLRDAELSFGRMKLHLLLDCPRTPTLEQAFAWLEDMRANSGGGPLSPQQLRACQTLADIARIKVAYGISDLPDGRPFPLPDRRGVLQPASDLLVDDAPWLDRRIDKSDSGKLPVVHDSIAPTTARRLGARSLSSAVQELPDGPMHPLQPAEMGALLGEGAGQAVGSQLAAWNKNVRSRAFRISVRRAMQAAKRGRFAFEVAAPEEAGAADVQKHRVDGLQRAAIATVAEIRSRFVVEQGDGQVIDVTLRSAGIDGGRSSDSLTVLGAGGEPTVYLKLAASSSSGSSEPPLVSRQGSGFRALHKLVKRWKPCLATELDRFLGEGSVRDRMLLVELLDVDVVGEMADVMNLYRIPMAHFEHWIGSQYDEGLDGRPHALLEGDEGSGAVDVKQFVGKRVLFAAARVPVALREDAEAAADALLLGRLDRVHDQQQCYVTVTGDGETCLMDLRGLQRPPTQAEKLADATEADEASRKQERPSNFAVLSDLRPQTDDDDRANDGGMRPPTAASLAAATPSASGADAPSRGDDEHGDVVTRVEYTPAQGWEESELAARKALADRLAARRAEAPAEREPEGIDRVLRKTHAIEWHEFGGEKVPMGSREALVEGSNVQAAVRTTPGYDLVRVGNFTERVTGEPADIAFFHHYHSLDELYNEARFGRQRLVRECCGALRDVLDGVFGFDAAKVTLFYEKGAASRFVRQKLLFNIWPIEEHKAKRRLADVRTDAFVYAYFYGLAVHKLAHFFDVVHGTRHDFFMSEYRANYDLQWLNLLLARGFDPAAVEREWRHLLWKVVD